ncbi:hypothetical protein OG21DRAFT_841650 [Imleria badia]|nr:hypothetical protein OG21DRAFT_841650 [Imleria badia]
MVLLNEDMVIEKLVVIRDDRILIIVLLFTKLLIMIKLSKFGYEEQKKRSLAASHSCLGTPFTCQCGIGITAKHRVFVGCEHGTSFTSFRGNCCYNKWRRGRLGWQGLEPEIPILRCFSILGPSRTHAHSLLFPPCRALSLTCPGPQSLANYLTPGLEKIQHSSLEYGGVTHLN